MTKALLGGPRVRALGRAQHGHQLDRQRGHQPHRQHRRQHRRRGHLHGLLLLLLALGCGPPDDRLTLDGETTGCRAVLTPGPRCVLGDDSLLTVWLPLEASAQVTASAGVRIIERRVIQEGQQLRLEISQPVQQVELIATQGTRQGVWRLAVEHRPEPPWWITTRRLQEAGDFTQAATWLERQLEDPATAADRGDQLYRLAGLVYRRGDTDRAQALMAEAMDWYRGAGRPLDAVRSGTALSYWLHADDRWAAERQLLDALDQAAPQTAEGAFLVDFFQGQLALKSGDLRTAQRRLRSAVRQAERLGFDRFRHQGEQLLATALAQAGRRDDAARLLQRLARDEANLATPCERALFFNSLAWSRLLELEAGSPVDAAPSPRDDLETAAGLMANCDAANAAAELANIYTNLALWYWHAEAPSRSRDYLRQAAHVWPRPNRNLLLWWREIEARLASMEGDQTAALDLFAEQGRLAAEALLPRAQWRAAVGTARTLWRLDRPDDAFAAFEQAERLLDSEALRVPIGDDRAAFAAQREWASTLYLEALLAADRPRQAMAAARRARSRVLRSLWRGQRLAHLAPPDRQRWSRAMAEYHTTRSSLEQSLRDAWQLPADRLGEVQAQQARLRSELETLLDQALQIIAPPGDATYSMRPLAAGEVVLTYHPGGGPPPGGPGPDDTPEDDTRKGGGTPPQTTWLGFAEGHEQVVAEALGPIDLEAPPDALARRLLEPFRHVLAGATSVRLMPYGKLRDVDFHRLPFDDQPLIVQRPVTYGLDLPTVETDGEPSTGATLMVIDPNQDLPSTRLEAAGWRDSLPSADAVHWLQGPAAEGDAVRRLLAQVDHFHFAGHGTFDGWDSALLLADDSRLSVGDIFALPRVPRRVILSGCETGRSGQGEVSRLEDADGIGAAFLTTGSREVVATQRPVDDLLAADLMAQLYRRWQGGVSVSEALRQAQITMYRQRPESDWASFRALEP